MTVAQWCKRILPKSVLNIRHFFFAWWGAVLYRHPSRELIVIGITGTSGKSSTAFILRTLLEEAGLKVGSLSTIDFYIAGEQQWNDQKMTMLGKMQVQRYLRDMVHAGCDVAIVETTSEGYIQHRHRFISYDAMVLTNLYPEHIDSHGSFEKYMAAKQGIVSYVASLPKKYIKGKEVPRFCVLNAAVPHIESFFSDTFPHTYFFARNDEELFVDTALLSHPGNTMLLAKDTHIDIQGLHFLCNGLAVSAQLYGDHNVSNILAAFGVCLGLHIPLEQIYKGLARIHGIPGRIEFIEDAVPYGFQVIVDYAFEPKAMQRLYDVVSFLAPKRIIHVFGSTGGGRDIERRFTVGRMVGERATIAIVTDEDPYDDDPLLIMNDVAKALRDVGKQDQQDLFIIEDRKQAIEKAVSLAQPGDIVLITGKGSEQAMVVKGNLVPWDDRTAVRGALRLLS